MSPQRMRDVPVSALVDAVKMVSIVGKGCWGDAQLVADEIRRVLRDRLAPRGLAVEVRYEIYQILMHSWHSGDITVSRPMVALHDELSAQDYWELMKGDFVEGRSDGESVMVLARVAAIALKEPVEPLRDDEDDEDA